MEHDRNSAVETCYGDATIGRNVDVPEAITVMDMMDPGHQRIKAVDRGIGIGTDKPDGDGLCPRARS